MLLLKKKDLSTLIVMSMPTVTQYNMLFKKKRSRSSQQVGEHELRLRLVGVLWLLFVRHNWPVCVSSRRAVTRGVLHVGLWRLPRQQTPRASRALAASSCAGT